MNSNIKQPFPTSIFPIQKIIVKNYPKPLTSCQSLKTTPKRSKIMPINPTPKKLCFAIKNLRECPNSHIIKPINILQSSIRILGRNNIKLLKCYSLPENLTAKNEQNQHKTLHEFLQKMLAQTMKNDQKAKTIISDIFSPRKRRILENTRKSVDSNIVPNLTIFNENIRPVTQHVLSRKSLIEGKLFKTSLIRKKYEKSKSNLHKDLSISTANKKNTQIFVNENSQNKHIKSKLFSRDRLKHGKLACGPKNCISNEKYLQNSPLIKRFKSERVSLENPIIIKPAVSTENSNILHTNLVIPIPEKLEKQADFIYQPNFANFENLEENAQKNKENCDNEKKDENYLHCLENNGRKCDAETSMDNINFIEKFNDFNISDEQNYNEMKAYPTGIFPKRKPLKNPQKLKKTKIAFE